MTRPELQHPLHYTPAADLHGHWQITDASGQVLVCPHQPPTPELLDLLGITPDPAAPPTPEAGSTDRAAQNPASDDPAGDPAPEVTPATVAAAITGPGDAETPGGPGAVWTTDTVTGHGPGDASYSDGETRWERLPQGAPLAYIGQVEKVIARANLTREHVAQVVREPEWVEAQRGDALACHRDATRVVIGGDGTVLHVSRDPTPRPEGARTRSVGMRPGTGKDSRRAPMPTTRQGLIDLLHDHGFTVTNGGKHGAVTHPDHPGKVPLPHSPSDHRWIPNSITQIRQKFGIDLRAPKSPNDR